MRLEQALDELPWGLHDAHLLGVEMDWLALEVRLLLAAPTDENQRHDTLPGYGSSELAAVGA